MVNTPMFKRILHNGFFGAIFTSVIKISSFFKVSLIFGSLMAFFSMTSVMMPLSGAFGGASGVFAVSSMLFIVKTFIFGGFITFKYLAYHIPGIFAALYWTTRSAWLRVLVPLLCMAAFIAHPVGGVAWAYSLYWLIPVALYFVPQRNTFLEALGSTFMAHAVGSVIWMYAVPMTPFAWLALIPVVAIERLVFAAGMALVYKAVFKILELFKAGFSLPASFFLSHKN